MTTQPYRKNTIDPSTEPPKREECPRSEEKPQALKSVKSTLPAMAVLAMREQSANDGHFTMFLVGGPYGNLHVLPKGGEKVYEAFDREGAGTVAHQGGDIGLLDAEDVPGFGLDKAARLDEAVDLQSEPCFQEFLFGMGKTEIGKHIPATLFWRDRHSLSRGHVSFAFLCGDGQPQPGGGG